MMPLAGSPRCRPARTVPVLIVIALVLVSGAAALETRNVFIVAIDGLRSNEGFETGGQNLPCIWDSLRPRGTFYTNFHNTGVTVTNSAHSTIVTGVRQLMRNNCEVLTPVRPREPTVAEYYRKAFGLSADDAAIVDGKSWIWRYPVSTWPGYGYTYAPRIYYTGDDEETWERTRSVIASHHPSLCYVLLASVDDQAHGGDTASYIAAIRRADSLVLQLWNLLQSDSAYRDSTTLIVTTDHGRHDDAHGGWQDHGCWCHGCRHTFLLALGPDIKPDTVITDVRDQVDIAPTVGHLLGFDTPLAQGNVLSEMLTESCGAQPGRHPADGRYSNVSNSPGVSRACDIASSPAGLHCVYADNSSGSWTTYYTNSTDQGTTWSLPVPLLRSEDIEYSDPVIASFAAGGLFVAAAGRRRLGNDTTSIWTLGCRRSINNGADWYPAYDLQTLGTVSCRPAVAARDLSIELLSVADRALVERVSRSGGCSFEAPETLCADPPAYALSASAALLDTVGCAAWQTILPATGSDSADFHNIWFSREPWQGRDTMLTRNNRFSYSYEPSLAADRTGVLHLAYIHLLNSWMGNDWQVNYRRSTDAGRTWSQAVKLSPEHVGYAPRIQVSDSGRLFCIWTALSGDRTYIEGACSYNGGLDWSTPTPITSPDTFSVEPRFACVGDTCFIVWSSPATGNWEVHFERYIFAPAGATAPDPASPRATASVVPNPFTDRAAILVHAACKSAAVYNSSGRLVRSFGHSQFVSRQSSIVWDGADDAGRPLPAGVYTCVVETARGNSAQRLVLTR